MTETLPNNLVYSPSRSPHQHVLRPRPSFYRPATTFSPKQQAQLKSSINEPESLRSPLKLADGVASTSANNSNNGKAVGRGRGGALLFPASPDHPRRTNDRNILNDNNNTIELRHPPSATSALITRRESSSGLRKLATSLSGAFASKGRPATRRATKQGFDLSDWNDDLAAIASHPSSSASSPTTESTRPLFGQSSKHHPSLSILPSGPTHHYPRDGLITPTTTVSFPVASALLRGLDHGVVLEIPAETRRRKSDEMEEEDRVDFHSPAPPVRRDRERTHSLAHAHTLRSSRTLSHHASLLNETTSPVASTSTSSSTLFAPTSPFQSHHSTALASTSSTASSSFVAPGAPRTRLSSLQHDSDPSMHSHHLHPPSKKVSVQETDSDDSDDHQNVFGGGPPKRSNRAKSFSRPTTSKLAVVLPASNSHPGWIGDGFESVGTKGKGSNMMMIDQDEPVAVRTRGKSGVVSSASNLETLSESGPAIDHFSVAGGGGSLSSGEGEGGMMGMVASTSSLTPARRRGEGAFNLMGTKVASTAAAVRHSSDQQHYFSSSSSTSSSTAQPFSSRRAASLDSLYLASSSLHPSPQPPTNRSSYDLRDSRSSGALGNGGGRKRNANGALLVGAGSTQGSRLAATSPMVAAVPSSPAPWNARDTRADMDAEDEDEDDAMMQEDGRGTDGWGENVSHPPSLTDGTTTSASSSLSTSLSSHADPDQSIDSASTPLHESLKRRNSSQPTTTGGGLFTPQNYKHVRPLQAAFMSTGLVSKRSKGRNDSGIGLGATPYRPLHLSIDTTTTLHPLTFDTTTASNSATIGSTNDLLTAVNPTSTSRNLAMPDTPVKRAAFAHPPSTSRLTLVPDVLIAPSPARFSSFRESTSPEGTIVNSQQSGGSSSSGSRTKLGMNSPSPCGRNEILGGDMSPTARIVRSAIMESSSGNPKRPSLFRRRSSEQVSNSEVNLRMRVGRSGSSTGSSNMIVETELEPMTPTRSVGTRWSEASQLVGTPTSPGTPNALQFPSSYLAPVLSSVHFADPPLATPLLRQSYPFSTFGHHQLQPQQNKAVPLGRHSFRERHSGPSLLAQQQYQQQDIQAPNRFETNYTILASLGNGEFSDAFEVADKERAGVFAVKRTKHAFGGPKDRLRRLEEVDILRLISSEPQQSPHLIHLVDAWEQNGHLFIQTELCGSGNLNYFLEEYGRLNAVLDETRVWKILTEISAGVGFLHDRDVIHLDLKPANVFITNSGRLKIGDFGLATRWPRTDSLSIVRGAGVTEQQQPQSSLDTIWNAATGERRVRAKSNGDIPASEDLEREGDREYIAPEIMGGRYGKAADIFSVGLVILEAAANVVLPDNGLAWHKLRSNDFSDVDLSRLSHELVVLLTGMLDKSPDERLTIDEVNAHPIVSRLGDLLSTSLAMDDAALARGEVVVDLEEARPVLGAILPQNESFLYDLFTSVYGYEGVGDGSFGADGDDELGGDDSMEIDG